MNYMKVFNLDVANGKGTRITLFVSGCEHHCKGCYNQGTWDKAAGIEYTEEVENYIINTLNSQRIKYRGLSISGGEPLEVYNVETVLNLCKRVKVETDNKDIWLWTGFTFEELTDEQKQILPYIDILIDGKFIEEEKDLGILFRGSTNQRIIDVQKSLEQNKTVLHSLNDVRLRDKELHGRRV